MSGDPETDQFLEELVGADTGDAARTPGPDALREAVEQLPQIIAYNRHWVRLDQVLALAAGVQPVPDPLTLLRSDLAMIPETLVRNDGVDPDPFLVKSGLVKRKDVLAAVDRRLAAGVQPVPSEPQREVIARWIGQSGFIRPDGDPDRAWARMLAEADGLIELLAAVPSEPEAEPCPTCWQPVPVPQPGDHDYGIPLRAAPVPSEPLDVERLADAIHVVENHTHDQSEGLHHQPDGHHPLGLHQTLKAEAIAAEYARLAAPVPTDTPGADE